MLLTIEEAKLFLRVDYDDEDNLIDLLINNAEIYLKDAIDDYDSKISNENFKNKAKLAMLVLISNWYDNRDFTEFKVDEKVRYTIQSLIQQMKYGYYGDEDEIQE